MSIIKKYSQKYQSLPLGVKAAFWYMVCNFFQKGISTLTTPIFTRLMTTDQYGQFTLFTSWQSILLVVISLKLSGGVYQQGLVKFEDKKDEFTSSLLGLTTILVGVFFILYICFHSFFNHVLDMSTVVMVGMFASILASSAFSLWAYRCRMDYNYIPLVVITLLVGFLKPVTGIIAVLCSENKGEARILSVVLVEVVIYLFLYISIFKTNKTFYDKSFWKYALIFNIPLIPHFLSQSVLIQSDRIMINKMCGSEFVGIYGLAYSISMMMSLVNNAIKDTLTPWILKNIKKNNLKEIGFLSDRIISIVAVVDLLVIALAPELIKIFSPSSYHDAVWVIPPVSMSIFFTFLYCFFVDFEYYFEKTKFIMAASVISAILNIVLNYVFIRIYGYVAAGYTTLVSYILYCFLHYLCYRKLCIEELENGRAYNIRNILFISIGFLVLGFAFTALYKFIFVRLVLTAVILIILYIKRDILIELFKMKKKG